MKKRHLSKSAREASNSKEVPAHYYDEEFENYPVQEQSDEFDEMEEVEEILSNGNRDNPSGEVKHKYANIMMDYWFKRAFGSENSSKLLKLLLKELIPERTIKDLKYMPTEHTNPIPGMKGVRIDVECTDQSGARFIVEMQVDKQEFFAERMVYYSAYALLNQLKMGKPKDLKPSDMVVIETKSSRNSEFYDYPPVYMISLINFSLHKGSDDVLYRYEYYDPKHGELMTDRINFLVLELPNCKKALTPKATLLDNFCYAMRHMQFLDNRPPELKAEIFELLFESANISKFTPQEKFKYEIDMRTERDLKNQIATNYLNGRADGFNFLFDQCGLLFSVISVIFYLPVFLLKRN